VSEIHGGYPCEFEDYFHWIPDTVKMIFLAFDLWRRPVDNSKASAQTLVFKSLVCAAASSFALHHVAAEALVD